jgi:enterobactin synthetase component D
VAQAFARDLPFGRLVGVELPVAVDAESLEAFAAALLPEERAHARGLPPGRRATWIGGRVALRAALAEVGVDAGPLLATPRGAPLLPVGAAGSVSHKKTIAVALAARLGEADTATLGIDVELDRAPGVDIARRVLTDGELRDVEGLAPEARARAVLVAFSAKEAIYKALDPWVHRFVSFQEVALAGLAGGALRVVPGLPADEGPFSIELHEERVPGLVLAAARARRGASSGA